MMNPAAIIKNEQGSALVLVLTIIIILTIIAGVILSLEITQHRFIHREVERLQTLYEAEAGVYGAIQLLQKDPFYEVSDTLLTLTEYIASKVSVERVGGYYQIRSIAGVFDSTRQRQVTVRATVAERAPQAFERSVYLWDHTSRLNVAGSTTINGDIELGQRGVRQNTIAGIRYTGELNGVTRHNPNIAPPFFDDQFLQRALSRFDQVISDSLQRNLVFPEKSNFDSSVLLPSELPIFFVEGDLVVSRIDSSLLATPHWVVASGDIVLKGPLRFAAGTHFLAGKRIQFEGDIQGHDGVFYGRQSLSSLASTSIKGQFFSRQEIVIRDSTYVAYPSLLFLGGLDADRSRNIDIQGRAIVNGTIIHGYLPEPPKQTAGRIIVGENALVRGGIYNPYETELHGTLHGSVLTHRFFFYRSPTRYVNWLFDATIDIRFRPERYHVPLLFNQQPDLIVVSWDVSQPAQALLNQQSEVSI